MHYVSADYSLVSRYCPPNQEEIFSDGNLLFHCLSEQNDTDELRNLCNAMTPAQKTSICSYKNFAGKTPYDLAKSYEVRNLLYQTEKMRHYYDLPTKPCVLIMFSTEDGLDAAEIKEFCKAFPESHFNVLGPHQDLTRKEMLQKITEARQQRNISALIVAISGHGEAGVVCAKDQEDVKIQDIINGMSPPATKEMKGKPKVNRCQHAVKILMSEKRIIKGQKCCI